MKMKQRWTRGRFATMVATMMGAVMVNGAGSAEALASDTLAQDVSVLVEDVAQMAIAGVGIPAFIVSSAATAGGQPSVAKAPYDQYLQFTSVVPDGETRTIQAQLSSALPTGVALRLATSASTGSGEVGVAQHQGNGASGALLSTTPIDLITGIATGFTGDGDSDGVLLDYALEMTGEVGQMTTGDYLTEVTFTLAAATAP